MHNVTSKVTAKQGVKGVFRVTNIIVYVWLDWTTFKVVRVVKMLKNILINPPNKPKSHLKLLLNTKNCGNHPRREAKKKQEN